MGSRLLIPKVCRTHVVVATRGSASHQKDVMLLIRDGVLLIKNLGPDYVERIRQVS